MRRVFVDLYRTQLLACAGNKLTKVVIDYLYYLDSDNNATPETPGISNDLESSLAYIRDVLMDLGSVSV